MARNRRKRKFKQNHKQSGFHPYLDSDDKALTATVAEESSCTPETRNALTMINAMLHKGRSRAALERAKKLYSRQPTPEAETALLRVYTVRIQELQSQGRQQAAADMLDTVSARFPQATAQNLLQPVRVFMLLRTGLIDRMLAPLAHPNCDQTYRAHVHDCIRAHVTDPRVVADCSALSPDHDLRRAATAISTAMNRVCSEIVGERELPLPEVSRNNPFAPWKWLVLAISAFYREDDELARAILERIPSGSAPARLIPTMLAMMDGNIARLTNGGNRLSKLVLADGQETRRLLEHADRMFARDQVRQAMKTCRNAMSHIRSNMPDLLPEFEARVVARAMVEGWGEKTIAAALGKKPTPSARMFQLTASAREIFGRENKSSLAFTDACMRLARYRVHAIREGIFKYRSQTSASVLMHIFDLLTTWFASHTLLDLQKKMSDYLRNNNLSIPADPTTNNANEIEYLPDKNPAWFLYPRLVLEQATLCDPAPAIFTAWYKYAEQAGDDWHYLEKIAVSWHDAAPDDVKPLLHLMRLARNRRALVKARKYMEKAAAIDRINTDIALARRGLEMQIFSRHLGDGKTKLAHADLERIAELPYPDPQTKTAILLTLHQLVAFRQDDQETAMKLHYRLTNNLHLNCSLIKEPCFAFQQKPATDTFHLVPDTEFSPIGHDGVMLTALLGTGLGLDALIARWLPPVAIMGKPAEWVASMARITNLLEDWEVAAEVPPCWHQQILLELRNPKTLTTLNDNQLLHATACMLGSNMHQAVYLTSGIGLARNSTMQGDFLLLRAQSLPPVNFIRKIACLHACTHIARTNGNRQLLATARSIMEKYYHKSSLNLNVISILSNNLNQGKVDKLLEIETQKANWPDFREYSAAEEFEEYSFVFDLSWASRISSIDDDEYGDEYVEEEDDDEYDDDDEFNGSIGYKCPECGRIHPFDDDSAYDDTHDYSYESVTASQLSELRELYSKNPEQAIQEYRKMVPDGLHVDAPDEAWHIFMQLLFKYCYSFDLYPDFNRAEREEPGLASRFHRIMRKAGFRLASASQQEKRSNRRKKSRKRKQRKRASQQRKRRK